MQQIASLRHPLLTVLFSVLVATTLARPNCRVQAFCILRCLCHSLSLLLLCPPPSAPAPSARHVLCNMQAGTKPLASLDEIHNYVQRTMNKLASCRTFEEATQIGSFFVLNNFCYSLDTLKLQRWTAFSGSCWCGTLQLLSLATRDMGASLPANWDGQWAHRTCFMLLGLGGFRCIGGSG